MPLERTSPSPRAVATAWISLLGINCRYTFIGVLHEGTAEHQCFLFFELGHYQVHRVHVESIFEYLLCSAIGDILPPLVQGRFVTKAHEVGWGDVGFEINRIGLIRYRSEDELVV